MTGNRWITGLACGATLAALCLGLVGVAQANEIGGAAGLLTPAQAAKAAKSAPVKVEDSGCWEATSLTCYVDFLPRNPVDPKGKPVPGTLSIFRHAVNGAATADFRERIVAVADDGSAEGSVAVLSQSPKRITMLVQEPGHANGWIGTGGQVDGPFVVVATCSYGGGLTEQPPATLTPQQKKVMSQCVNALLTAQMKKAKR